MTGPDPLAIALDALNSELSTAMVCYISIPKRQPSALANENGKKHRSLDTGVTHAATIGVIRNLELFQIYPYGKYRVSRKRVVECS